eukprot:SAG31_NODE_4638_length_3079_cov_1.640940_2_plen_178_part_00
MLAAYDRIYQLRIRQFNHENPALALEGLHGKQMQTIVTKIINELKDTPWHRSKQMLAAGNTRSLARAKLNDRSWMKAKLDIQAILGAKPENADLLKKWGSGTDAEIDKLSNPECRYPHYMEFELLDRTQTEFLLSSADLTKILRDCAFSCLVDEFWCFLVSQTQLQNARTLPSAMKL